MKYFVVSDLHGYYTLTVNALKRQGFFNEENKKLIVCGDVLDRGGEANKLVDFLLRLKEKGELIYITGNHEDLFMQALSEIARKGAYEMACGMSHHYSNGTWGTLLQLASMSEREAVDYPSELIRRVRASKFYKELLPMGIDYYETKNHIFCHGWIPVIATGHYPNLKYKYDPKWREADIDKWKTARWLNGMDLSCKYHINEPRKRIVCGHWHASYGHAIYETDRPSRLPEFGKGADFSPFYAHGIVAIDACTANSRRVNCIVINDEELKTV